MEVYRRVFCRLKVKSEDLARLNSTVKAFEDACNYASEVAFKKGIRKHKVLHDRIYRELRAIFKLSAALAVRVIQKVASSYNELPMSCTFSKNDLYLLTVSFFVLRGKAD